MEQQALFDARANAHALLVRRFKEGESARKALLEKVQSTVIRDRLVPPKGMEFVPGLGEGDKELRLQYRGAEGNFSIHNHALGQLCAKVNLPMNFVSSLKGKEHWRVALLAHNLNELFHQPEWKDRRGDTTRFLHRIVGDQLRGFLTRRFNRHLASAPMLAAFSEACRKRDAHPVEAFSSDVRVSLKCMLPQVFEAYPGEWVAIGSEWGNSDFGSGKMSVAQSVWRVKTGTCSVLEDTLSRVHLGSVIEDSDIEMSDETARKEVAAISSAINDAVEQHLSTDHVEKMLDGIRAAHEHQIPWSKLKSQLSKFLGKKEVDWLKSCLDSDTSIIDLPPVSYSPDGERVPNAWWVSNAVSALAANEKDNDTKMDLQRQAGKLIASFLNEEEVD